MKTVILAAGFGSRLWPLSTSDQPKQFQHFINGRSLLQHTYALLSQVTIKHELYVLTLRGLEYLVFEQLPDIPADHVIIVPERRNTLPHTLYALSSLGLREDEQVLFTPVDYYFANPTEFADSLQSAMADCSAAPAETYLLGMPAHEIDRSLGYMIVDDDHTVTRFIEKPDAEQAETLKATPSLFVNMMYYIASLTSMDRLLDSMGEDEKLLAKNVLSALPAQLDEPFLAMPFLDISHGLFEKASGLKALPVEGNFVDIGKFAMLYKINPKDAAGNATVGNVIVDAGSRNNLLINQLDKPLVVLDAQDMVIVQTADGSVVSPLSSADKVGEIYKTAILPSAV